MKLATLCYLKRQGQTLMLLRNKKKNDIHVGKWNGLGGKFEPGESPEDCVRREVEEESGYRIQNPKLVGFLTFPEFKDGEDWYVFVYTADEIKGEMRDSAEGELAWIPDSKLLELNLWQGDYSFLPWIEEGRLFSAKFFYKNKELVSQEVIFHTSLA